MKIALHVDGVIIEAPGFFSALSAALREAGHEVPVLSDHDELLREERERELAEMGIEYDSLMITRRKKEHFEDLGFDLAMAGEAEAYFTRQQVIPVGLVRPAD
jgi:hypothetical protein